MINTSDINEILRSSGFKKELAQINSYAANIKLERPIVFLLAKCFYMRGREVILEKNKYGLSIAGSTVEVKYHFDYDIFKRFQGELKEFNYDLNRILSKCDAKKEEKKSITWRVTCGLLKDILRKNQIFSFGLLHNAICPNIVMIVMVSKTFVLVWIS